MRCECGCAEVAVKRSPKEEPLEKSWNTTTAEREPALMKLETGFTSGLTPGIDTVVRVVACDAFGGKDRADILNE